MLVTSHAWILAILSWGPADVSVGQRADTCCDVIATNVNCPIGLQSLLSHACG